MTARAASARYVTLATDGRRLHGAGIDTEVFGRILIPTARAHAAGAGDVIVWVHESAGWKMPRRPAEEQAAMVAHITGHAARIAGDSGWSVIDGSPKVHLAFPQLSGDFAGTADAGELVRAVEAFRDALGFSYAFSGPSTVHRLIGQRAELGAAELEPTIDYRDSAWRHRGSAWSGSLAGVEWVRCFDRSGSFLAAWSGLNCAAGAWSRTVGPWAGADLAGPETSKAPGYWLAQVFPPVPPAAGAGPDPLLRDPDPGPVAWLTTPALQIAADLGRLGTVYEAWTADRATRALDAPAARLGEARALLGARGDTAGAVALATLKAAYAGAVAWFEFGPQPPKPLARPYWRRAIIDRHAANTARALAKAAGLVGFANVDTAVFAVPAPDAVPDGLRLGDGLGAWKPAGEPVRVDAAVRRAFDGYGARELVEAARLGTVVPA